MSILNKRGQRALGYSLVLWGNSAVVSDCQTTEDLILHPLCAATPTRRYSAAPVLRPGVCPKLPYCLYCGVRLARSVGGNFLPQPALPPGDLGRLLADV